MRRSVRPILRLAVPMAAALTLGACGAGAAAPTSVGATCYAGARVCQLAAQAPVGSQCTCPGTAAPAFGVVR